MSRRIFSNSRYLIKTVPRDLKVPVVRVITGFNYGDRRTVDAQVFHSYWVEDSEVLDRKRPVVLLLHVLCTLGVYSVLAEHVSGVVVTGTLLMPPQEFTTLTLSKVLESVTPLVEMQKKAELVLTRWGQLNEEIKR